MLFRRKNAFQDEEEPQNVLDELLEKEELSIEELYQLIEQIKKDEEEYKKIVQGRKEFRNFDTTLHLPRIILFLLTFGIVVNYAKEKIIINNPFNNTKLTISDEKKDKILEEIEEKLNIKIPSEDIDNYILLSAVFDNQNLSLEQKYDMFDLLPILRDNELINKEIFFNTLKTLKINYTERPEFYDESTIGNYFFLTNSISIYIEKEQDKNDEVLKHEKIHSLFVRNNLLDDTLHFLTEGMTELLMNEYYGTHPFVEYENYIYEISLVKMLCEMTGEDKVLEAFTTGKTSIIYNSLDSIYGNKGDSKELLKKLDEIFDNYYEFDYKVSYEKLEKLIKQLENYYVAEEKEELKGLTECGYLMYDKRIINHAFYYYENLLLTSACNNHYKEYSKYLFAVGILQKAYFSSQLKEKITREDSKKVYYKKQIN